MKLSVYNLSGSVVDEVELDEAIFGVKPNVALMHQIVVGQEANRRVGTASTKTRAVIRGTTKKMYKQKGTGRARHGSRKVPSWIGGGVAHGPHPRSYDQHLPKKMRRAAIRSALSVKARDGQIVLLDALELAAPKTKEMIALLGRLPVSGKVLLTLDQASQNVHLSARNLQRVSTLPANALSTREVLRHDYLVATVPAIRALEQWLSPKRGTPEASVPDAPEVRPARRTRAASAAPAAAAEAEAEMPTAEAEAPTAEAQAPAPQVETPAAQQETATPEAETATPEVETPTPRRTRARAVEAAEAEPVLESSDAADESAPRRRSSRKSESDE
jgi:large subunit ribosomal protein L4